LAPFEDPEIVPAPVAGVTAAYEDADDPWFDEEGSSSSISCNSMPSRYLKYHNIIK